MSLDTLCQARGDPVLPGWLLLLFAPGWRWPQRCTTFAVSLLLAATYGWLLLHGRPPAGAGSLLREAVAGRPLLP